MLCIVLTLSIRYNSLLVERCEIKNVRTKAPVRFDFAGGPTDVEPFRSKESGFVVNGALDHSATVEITRRIDNCIVIYSDDYNHHESINSLDEIRIEGPLKLIKAAVKHISPSTGLEIHTRVDVTPGSGLGSSAALAIALLGGLRVIAGDIEPKPETLVRDALHVENVMLDNINGGQDQYASALGGFHSFNFEPDKVIVNTLEISEKTIAELEKRSVLCYSGESHISGNILNQIMSNYLNGNTLTSNALHRMKKVTYEIEQALLSGNLINFGKLIQTVFEIQRELHPEVVPQNIEEISKLALSNGALGGRIAGAGGGGCVYFFCEKGKKEDVIKVLKNQGLLSIPVKFAPKGIEISYL